MLLDLLPFVPMFYKHLWTAVNSPRGRYPGGLAARAVAIYEAVFYLWALTLGAYVALVVFLAAVHLVGVPLYFRGYLSRYSKYGKAYAAFEAFELASLVLLAAAVA
ncbi:MAG: hypothetical protein QXP98_02420 [Thermoproteus sp.]